jgi:hypothetical protein
VRKRLRWESEAPRLPKHPYRDTAILYAVLAGVIVLVSWLTGGSAGRAVVVAAFFFVLATAWSWSRFRTRIRDEARRKAGGATRLP